MARKSTPVTITEEGRDLGKTFLVTEMPPRQAEKWAARVLFAIAKSGGDDRDAEQVAATGMAGLAAVGIRSLTRMDFNDAEPLLDEMLTCVAFVPDPSKIDQFTHKPLVRPVDWDSDVEELSTIVRLRSEVIEVHTGFSPAAFLSSLGAATKTALNGAAPGTSPPVSPQS